MTRGRLIGWTLLALALSVAIVAAFLFLPRWYADSIEPPAVVEPAAAPTTARIKARLFYLSEDGLRLVAVEREVPFGEGTLLQARRIVEAQLEPPARPMLTAIPEGTRLRAIYLNSNGEAFVDLSSDVSTAHPGGALDEILTVYSVVNAVTTNLQAVRAVQILVDGHEVDTLAGHVDLRRPLPPSASWVQEPAAQVAPQAAEPPRDSPIPTGMTPPRDVPPKRQERH